MTEKKIMEYKQKAEELVAQMTVGEAAKQLCFSARGIPRLNVPDYVWWNEALHGVARAGTATVFPQAIALAAMFDSERLFEIADAIALEARAKYNTTSAHGDRGIYKGLTFWSPNINIFRDPRWGRGHETYGEDPVLTAQLGIAFIEGLQGDGDVMKAAACAKHYAVHSGPEKLRHEFNAICSAKDLWETYLPAFEACVIDAGVEAVMGAYNRTLDEPCCASQLLLVDILRGKWKFDGHVVSDCWALKDFNEQHGVCEDAQHAAAMAIKAGCDLNCGSVYSSLMDAYDNNLITEEDIRRAAIRLMTTRYKLGILGGEGSEYDNISFDVIDCAEHRRLNQKAAEESAVLLKNTGLLPLDITQLRSIAVIGPNADSRTALKGNYYGTPSRYVTINEGIRNYVGEHVRIHYAEGSMTIAASSSSLARPNDLIAEAVTAAEQSDLTLLVVGLDEKIEGEETNMNGGDFDGDKPDILLPLPQRELMKAVIQTGKPVVVILMAGSSIDLRDAQFANNVGGILCAWYPGAEGGTAVARLLFGDVSPSGKLPVTFYNSTDDLPEFTDYSMQNRTYRYFSGDVLYPFGYGKTYGKTSVMNATFNDGILSVKVQNKGRETSDVLQVYIKSKSKFAPNNPRLCAFKKVRFAASSSQELELVIPDEAFTVVNDEGERISGGENFTLYIGFGQPDKRTAELTGETCIKLDIKRRSL